jgi:hypothetical protein
MAVLRAGQCVHYYTLLQSLLAYMYVNQSKACERNVKDWKGIWRCVVVGEV